MTAPGTTRHHRHGGRSFLVELPFLVILTLALAALVRTFLVQPFFIPSGSMENTLQVGDRVLVDKVSYRFRDIRRGEIIVFNGVDSFTPQARDEAAGNPLSEGLRGVAGAVGLAPAGETDFIKRVIGLPGDRVVCCDREGRVKVNGDPVDESAYLYPGDDPSEQRFDVVVPKDRLWVMGDHRSRSADSRAHLGDPGGGTVPVGKVIGRAFSVVWPPSELTGLGTPAAFDRVRHAGAALGDAAPYALAFGAALPRVPAWLRRRTGTED